MDKYILDENDCPRFVDFDDYHKWHQSLPKDIQTGLGFTLARDETSEVLVSTVYLGMDYAYGDGPPVLWETMVFCSGDEDQTCERATSRSQAMENHRKFCERYLKKKA